MLRIFVTTLLMLALGLGFRSAVARADLRAKLLVNNESLSNELSGRGRTFLRNFVSCGGDALFFINTAGYTQSDGGDVGFDVFVGKQKIYTTALSAPRRLLSTPIVASGILATGLSKGTHALLIQFSESTHTSAQDRIYITYQESCKTESP